MSRIQAGMDWWEVNEILGGPPGVYSSQPMYLLLDECRIAIPWDSSIEDCKRVRWWGDDGAVDVVYEPSGRVTGVEWCRCEPMPLGPFGWLIWRVERLWRSIFSYAATGDA
jgi:hypothetical protein